MPFVVLGTIGECETSRPHQRGARKSLNMRSQHALQRESARMQAGHNCRLLHLHLIICSTIPPPSVRSSGNGGGSKDKCHTRTFGLTDRPTSSACVLQIEIRVQVPVHSSSFLPQHHIPTSTYYVLLHGALGKTRIRVVTRRQIGETHCSGMYWMRLWMRLGLVCGSHSRFPSTSFPPNPTTRATRPHIIQFSGRA